MKRSHPGTLRARKQGGDSSVRQEASVPCPGGAQAPGSGSPAKQCSQTQPLHGAHLPTWCRQATALRKMGKTLSASPRLPLLLSNHAIGSDQSCHLVLPLKSCPSAFHLAPTQTPAQPTSPKILVRACPGPGNILPRETMDSARNVCAGSFLALE